MSEPVIPVVPVRRTGPAAWLYRMKDWVEAQAHKPHAAASLFGLAFVESFIFPIPPDGLLIPLATFRPKRAFHLAAIATLGSVLGAFVGYAIGYFLWYDGVGPAATYSGLAEFFFDRVPGVTQGGFERVRELYQEHGFWVIFTAGFTPIPYKLFTVTAGTAQIGLLTFFVASAVSRAARFFLVAALLYFFGERVRVFIDRYLGWLTIAFTVLLVGGFVVLTYVLD